MSHNPRTPKQYEELGRIVAAVHESGYLDKRQMYKTSFIKGLVTGFGGVIGGTVVVAAVIWLLSLFGEVPLLGHFIDKANETINSQRVSE